jgi:predicted transcriptional regulator
MAKDVSLSVRIDRKLSNKLEKLARQARRSKSAMAIFAIETYLDVQDQKREVEKRRWLDGIGPNIKQPKSKAARNR